MTRAELTELRGGMNDLDDKLDALTVSMARFGERFDRMEKDMAEVKDLMSVWTSVKHASSFVKIIAPALGFLAIAAAAIKTWWHK